jgi:hypothetical protein
MSYELWHTNAFISPQQRHCEERSSLNYIDVLTEIASFLAMTIGLSTYNS